MAAVNKTLKDGAGADFNVQIQDTLGRQAAAESPSHSLSTEDKDALDLIATKLDLAIADLGSLVTAANSTTDGNVEIHSPVVVTKLTPTLDTSAYAAGDVLFATTELTGVARTADGISELQSLNIVDKSKQNPALTLLFYGTAVTSAAANAANNLSDADQLNFRGSVSIAAADWKTWANNSTVSLGNIGKMMKAAIGTADLYVVGILEAGTPTFANGDLQFSLAWNQA